MACAHIPASSKRKYNSDGDLGSFRIGRIALAWFLYVGRPALAESAKTAAGPLYTLVSNKYYVDEIYSLAIVKPLELFSKYVLWKGVDDNLIDKGAVNGLGHLIRGWGNLFRLIQSGSIEITQPGFWPDRCLSSSSWASSAEVLNEPASHTPAPAVGGILPYRCSTTRHKAALPHCIGIVFDYFLRLPGPDCFSERRSRAFYFHYRLTLDHDSWLPH